MKSKKIIIGSRGSKLALIYAEKAKEKILKVSKEFNIEIIEQNIYTFNDSYPFELILTNTPIIRNNGLKNIISKKANKKSKNLFKIL